MDQTYGFQVYRLRQWLSLYLAYWNVPVKTRTAPLARVTVPVKVPPAVADTLR